jgi:hypothetical protein
MPSHAPVYDAARHLVTKVVELAAVGPHGRCVPLRQLLGCGAAVEVRGRWRTIDSS